MINHRYLPLSVVRKYEPEMGRLGVSVVARSGRGFLTAYKEAGGRDDRLSEFWRRRREGFIARHLAQYRQRPTYRRWLALVAWAYRLSGYPPSPARAVRAYSSRRSRSWDYAVKIKGYSYMRGSKRVRVKGYSRKGPRSRRK